MNLRGEVVGVNTLAFKEGGATGLNFAIFDSEILDMLKKHFDYVPDYLREQPAIKQDVVQADTTQLSAMTSTQLSTGANEAVPAVKAAPVKTAVMISSEPTGAEISVDGQFDSSTPSKLLLSPGEHIIRVTRPGFELWERKITVEVSAEKTLHALLEKETSAIKSAPR